MELRHQTERNSENLIRYLFTAPYLGHAHVADTQWYLSGSPELTREAMRRLEQRWEDRS
jgi:integrase/recombinase XerD